MSEPIWAITCLLFSILILVGLIINMADERKQKRREERRKLGLPED